MLPGFPAQGGNELLTHNSQSKIPPWFRTLASSSLPQKPPDKLSQAFINSLDERRLSASECHVVLPSQSEEQVKDPSCSDADEVGIMASEKLTAQNKRGKRMRRRHLAPLAAISAQLAKFTREHPGAVSLDPGNREYFVAPIPAKKPAVGLLQKERVTGGKQQVDHPEPLVIGGRVSSERVQEDEEGLTWIESSGNQQLRYFAGKAEGSPLKTRELRDERKLPQRLLDAFMARFFPVNFPNSVSDGYLTYSKYRAIQHCAGAIFGVLSTQSMLLAAGLRPTPAQATIVSWVLKDGLQHVGKLSGASLGARMDADPKRWRVFADVMYDMGAFLEVLLPLWPSQFFQVAGLANVAKGLALVAARSTRLPIYSSFAKENNLSDLYAKGEAISVLSHLAGMAIGIRLAASVCKTPQAKLAVAPVLSAVHLFCVSQEMRAAPVNTLNAARTSLLVSHYLETGEVPWPGDLRYKERLFFPMGLDPSSGSVRVGAPIAKAAKGPRQLAAAIARSGANDRFLLAFSDKQTDLILHRTATGEDTIRGWLLAACAARSASEKRTKSEGPVAGQLSSAEDREAALEEAHEKMEELLPPLFQGLKDKGWHTHQFLEGSGVRAIW